MCEVAMRGDSGFGVAAGDGEGEGDGDGVGDDSGTTGAKATTGMFGETCSSERDLIK